MPRKPLQAMCKICGANATLVHHQATGANGIIYFYEKYVHRNGKTHYFRQDRKAQSEEASVSFEDLIDTKMNNGKYRFKEIKLLIESVNRRNVSNTMVYRSIEKAIRANSIEKNIEEGIIYYSKRINQDSSGQLKIKEAFVTYVLSDSTVNMTILLLFENLSGLLMNRIPITLPTGTVDSQKELHLQVFDQMGPIPEKNVEMAYSFSSQTGIAINFNKPLKPNEFNFVFMSTQFKTRERMLKFALPLYTNSLKLYVTLDHGKPVHIIKRLLDGVKETNPDLARKGTLNNGQTYKEVEFNNASWGEAIIVSW
jgi:hypothetical protein